MEEKVSIESKVRILFWVPYPKEGQSNRFRVEQYLPYLNAEGIGYSLRPFISSEFYRVLYRPGGFPRKFYFFMKSFLRRIIDLLSIFKYDLVFVHREAFPFGPPIFEILAFKCFKKPLVYDFDDAIFLGERSESNRAISFLKNPGKVARIITLSQQVIVGNNYLNEYAEQFNKNITVIPTPIDTEKYKPFNSPHEKNGVVVGWIGSHSTAGYLLELKDVFQQLKKDNSDLVIRLIGAEKYEKLLPGTECRAWTLEDEIEELGSFDIGLMPMPDNPWTKGKCAFKLLLYMSMGTPAVCSPVEMNKEVIRDGENGFLASSAEEWFYRIQTLIKDQDLRKRIGLQGRKIVEEKYALSLWAPAFIEVLKKAIERQ
jgi:glycosyltransferase involved in cell wall biosynthesis